MNLPDLPIVYNKKVGELRQNNIAKVLTQWGYEVRTAAIEANEADIWVRKNRRIVALLEVLNWRKSDYLTKKRAQSIISNLAIGDCHKFLICSFPENIENERIRELIEKKNIQIIYLGFQTQPPDYYEFFVQNEIVDQQGMKLDSPELMQQLRERLKPMKDLRPIGKRISLKKFRRQVRY